MLKETEIQKAIDFVMMFIIGAIHSGRSAPHLNWPANPSSATAEMVIVKKSEWIVQ